MGIAASYPPPSDGAFWLTILWAAWIIAVAWTLTRRSFSLLFAAVMAAMFLFVIYPATAAQVFHQTTIAGIDESAGVVRALEIAALAQCGMLAGAIAARTLGPIASFNRLSLRLSSSRLDRAARRSVAAGTLGAIALCVLGGTSLLDFFVYTRSSGSNVALTSGSARNLAYLTAVQCLAGLALVLLPLRLGSTSTGRRLGPLLLAASATFLLLGGGERGRFFVPVFAAGLVWLKTSNLGRHPRRVAAAGVIVMILLSGLVGVARGSASTRQVTVNSILAQPFGSGNNLFLPLAAMASTVPGQFPYLDGTSYWEAAVFPIPRALWPGKPQDALVLLTRTFDRDSGLAVPEFGEMYVNFGLLGVMAGSLLLGALVELLSIRFFRSASIRESVFLALCSAVLLDIFTRGAVAPMLTTFEPLLAVAGLICRRRSPVLADARKPVPLEIGSPAKSQNPVTTP